MMQNMLSIWQLQLWLATIALAAPVGELDHIAGWGTGGGVVGFIILVLDIVVFVEVLQSNRPVSHKVLWCLVVFLFPLVGMIVYWLFSNRQAHNRGGYEVLP